jgi:excisionase family DNA binding protein
MTKTARALAVTGAALLAASHAGRADALVVQRGRAAIALSEIRTSETEAAALAEQQKKRKPDVEKMLYSIAQAAAVLDISVTTVYEELSAGRLKSVSVRSSRKITREELRRFISTLPETVPGDGRPIRPRRSEIERQATAAVEAIAAKPVKPPAAASVRKDATPRRQRQRVA